MLASADDPLDLALFDGARERGVSREALLSNRRVVGESPLDPVKRGMSVSYDDGTCRETFAKGAPETLLEDDCPLRALADAWAEQGLRVLAVARGPGSSEATLVPVGLIALADPLRPAARGAVVEARRAGIRVKLLTGDHPATARTIGS